MGGGRVCADAVADKEVELKTENVRAMARCLIKVDVRFELQNSCI
jgi:hypothetical protein